LLFFYETTYLTQEVKLTEPFFKGSMHFALFVDQRLQIGVKSFGERKGKNIFLSH
jgi:hypothetical protein